MNSVILYTVSKAVQNDNLNRSALNDSYATKTYRTFRSLLKNYPVMSCPYHDHHYKDLALELTSLSHLTLLYNGGLLMARTPLIKLRHAAIIAYLILGNHTKYWSVMATHNTLLSWLDYQVFNSLASNHLLSNHSRLQIKDIYLRKYPKNKPNEVVAVLAR